MQSNLGRYCDLLFDACYATEPSCSSDASVALNCGYRWILVIWNIWICSGHVYNDDEKGTKLVMTRVRPSFVQRLLWSNAASDDLVVQASDPQIPQQESEPCTSIASNAPWRAQFFWWSRNQNIFSSLNVFGSIVSWSQRCVLSLIPCLFLLEP